MFNFIGHAVGNVGDAVANVGDAVADVAKKATGAVEDVVQETGVGKAFESIGVKVDANIHENGLNTNVTGPLAEGLSLGNADKLESHIKVKTAGGDVGGKASGAVKDGDVTLVSAGAGVDKNGAYANVAVGISVNSGFTEIKTITDFNSVVTKILKKIMDTKQAKFARMVQEETGMDFVAFIRKVMDELVEKLHVGGGIEYILKLKGEYAKIYLDVGGSITAGIGATFKAGMDEEVTIMDKNQTFKMYQLGGTFSLVEGVGAGFGYSKSGKTFDGYDEGAYLLGSASAASFSASVGLIITANVGCNLIDTMKGAAESF